MLILLSNSSLSLPFGRMRDTVENKVEEGEEDEEGEVVGGVRIVEEK